MPPGGAGLVDRGARQAEHDLGGEAVGQLGVDVVGADDALGELGPGVGVLVGEVGPAEDGDAARLGGLDRGGRLGEGDAPGGGGERVALADERGTEAVVAVDRLEPEAALVAEPAPVHRVDVDALVAEDLVAARLHHDPAADRAAGAGALDLVEVPRPGLEAVRRRGERADRADLHRVAAEVAGEGVVGERVDLGLVPAVLEVDERVAGDVLGEPRAPVAQDAALAVEGHEVADRDRLLEVALLLDEPALARAVGHGLVLQRALAALVAHRAVERVVDQEELEDAVLRLLRGLALGVDDHLVGHRDHAGGLEGGAAAGVDVDDAHAAHAHRLHARVVAEARDVGAGPLGGLDHELAGRGLHGLAVDREDDHVRRGLTTACGLRVRHQRPPAWRCTPCR